MQDRRIVGITGMKGDLASPAVVAGGLIFTSATTGLGADGRLAGPDIQSQTRAAIDRLGVVLTAAGSSLAQAVSLQVYLKNASDFEAMNAAYRQTFADQPPVRTTVMADLPAGVLIALAAIAVPTGAARETLHPAGWMKSPRPYSFIVRAGDWVFLSGLVSRRPSDDQPVPGPVDLQTKTILDNAGALLKTAGLSYENVVASRVFITDDTYFEEMNDQYRRYFTSSPPARATAVAGLMGNDARVEITLIASAAPKRILGPSVSPSLPLSSAVLAGDLLFLSGVLGNTDANADDSRSADARGLRPRRADAGGRWPVVQSRRRTDRLPDRRVATEARGRYLAADVSRRSPRPHGRRHQARDPRRTHRDDDDGRRAVSVAAC